MNKKIILVLLTALLLFYIGNTEAATLWANIKLLAHWNGTDGQQTYTTEDADAQTVTFVGTAQLDTAAKKFGSASILFDGDSDYVTVPDSASWTFGTGDFTIDFWFNFTNLPGTSGTYIIIEHRTDGDNKMQVSIYESGGSYYWEFRLKITSTTILVQKVSPGINTGTWYHYALTRASNVFRFFQNGTQCGADVTDTDTIPDLTGALQIGAGDGTFYKGAIDELRIIKGSAAWTANFTPPTTEYSEAYPDDNAPTLSGQIF